MVRRKSRRGKGAGRGTNKKKEGHETRKLSKDENEEVGNYFFK